MCRVVSCRVVSCRVVSCRVVSCRVVSCRVVSCRVVSCRVVSCRVVSCRVVSLGDAHSKDKLCIRVCLIRVFCLIVDLVDIVSIVPCQGIWFLSLG